jgi:hypothetical protein
VGADDKKTGIPLKVSFLPELDVLSFFQAKEETILLKLKVSFTTTAIDMSRERQLMGLCVCVLHRCCRTCYNPQRQCCRLGLG